MTRKDYRLLATTVALMKLTALAKITVAEDLADALEKENKAFRRDIFLKWCGLP